MIVRDGWLASRYPEPPVELLSSLEQVREKQPLKNAIVETAREALAEACSPIGKVRARAFVLLEADALITYACEAALEADDPGGALRRVLAAVVE